MNTNAPLLPTPENFEVYEGLSQLVISYRWMKPIYYFTLAFSIAWWSFLIFWYSAALSDLAEGGEGSWMAVIFPIGHVAAGVYIAYLTVCGFLNKTSIEVTHSALEVRHTPLPWPGAKKLQRTQIKQLYTVQHAQSGRGGTTLTYQVLAITADNKSVTLLQGFETAQHGQFIEQKIEKFLGIENQRVAGEYGDVMEQPQRRGR